jgi:hypothetical protein
LANPTSDRVPDVPDGQAGVAREAGRARGGLRLREPGPSAPAVASALGTVWGLLGYSVLWEGVPFAVQRPFVQSVPGTLVLLPVRTALWAIHRAELLADRTFDLSGNHWWIAPASGLLGAAIAVAIALGARATVRTLRGRGRLTSRSGDARDASAGRRGDGA